MLNGCYYVALVIVVMLVGEVGGSLFDNATINSILDRHNEMRRGEPASNMKKLQWNGVLARMASEWAEECQSCHGQPQADDRPFEVIGQNMNIFSRRQDDYVISIKAWIDEKVFYDYDTMTCEEGKICGHYTQLVWAESGHMGCGYAKCSLIVGLNLNYGDVFICNYGPAGNIRGVKPYKIGDKCSECPEEFKCEDEICVSPDYEVVPRTTDSSIEDDQLELEQELSDLPPEFDLNRK